MPTLAQLAGVPGPADTDSPEDLRSYLIEQANYHGVDPRLAESIFQQESSGGRNAGVSPAGARGPMQLMPATFKQMYPEGNIDDPRHNIEAGVRYLAHGQKVLGTKKPDLIAAGYYQGFNRDSLRRGEIRDTNTDPRFPSVQEYADQVASRAGGGHTLAELAGLDMSKMSLPGATTQKGAAAAPKKERTFWEGVVDTGRNLTAGALKIGPTALKGAVDIADMATGGKTGLGSASDYLGRGMEAINELVASASLNQQQAEFGALMSDDEKGVGDMFSYLLDNPALIVDQSLTTIGSMFLPVGAAGGAAKLAKLRGLSKSAQTKAAVAASIGTAGAQNAADTFAQLEGQPTDQRYAGAAVSFAVSTLMGIATGGGAEGQVARMIAGDLQAGRIGLDRVKAFLKSVGKDAAQESGEELGNVAGEVVGSEEASSVASVGKRTALAGALGGVLGGGVDLAAGGPRGEPANVAGAAPTTANAPDAGASNDQGSIAGGVPDDAEAILGNAPQQAATPATVATPPDPLGRVPLPENFPAVVRSNRALPPGEIPEGVVGVADIPEIPPVPPAAPPQWEDDGRRYTVVPIDNDLFERYIKPDSLAGLDTWDEYHARYPAITHMRLQTKDGREWKPARAPFIGDEQMLMRTVPPDALTTAAAPDVNAIAADAPQTAVTPDQVPEPAAAPPEAESQAPAPEAGDAGVAPGQEAAAPDSQLTPENTEFPVRGEISTRATDAPASEPVSQVSEVSSSEDAESVTDGAAPSSTPRRGKVGDMLSSGEVVLTASGRPTTPFPKVSMGTDRKTTNTVRAVDRWLLENAAAEARSRGDDTNARVFEADAGAKSIPPASKDAAEEYLFGEQPPVLPGILKPLSPRRDSEAWKNEGKTDAQRLAEKVDAAGKDLAGTIYEESREKDFAPNELPEAVRLRSGEEGVPADDLRDAVLGHLGDYDFSEGRKKQIRNALQAESIRKKPDVSPPARSAQDAEVPKRQQPTAESLPEASIQDAGEKIGGARKDTAMSAGPRALPKEEQTEPGWQKRYSVSRIEKSNRPNDVGRWTVRDTRRTDPMGQSRQIGDTFATEEDAKAAVPLIEVARNHQVVVRSGNKGEPEHYVITRNVTDRRRVTVVEQQFPTREDAMRYMAGHAVQIIETKTSFGEEILPRPDKVQRTGVARRTGDVTANDFMSAFDFRGIEFGNWNAQDERQSVMNHAYDALMDLADVMRVPPQAIGLNGELALAFGARGHGLIGARAHYERDYGVINLTKMKGAGSLAHEWFHALDHYFGRQDGKAPRDRKPNERGDLVFGQPSADRAYASHGFLRKDSGVRDELRAIYERLIKTMHTKAETYVQDSKQVERFTAETRDLVAKRLQSLRNDLAKESEYRKRNNKPASAEQLAAFDEIAETIISGEMLETSYRTMSQGAGKATSIRWTNDALEQLSAIYKAVRGRSGFDATNQSGVLDDLRGHMKRYGDRLKMLAEAQAGAEKTKRVPTNFAMEAKSIDQGRTGDYWYTEHEMAARAFQAYVEDKVSESGGQSDFLVYGTNRVIPTPWGWKRPFPHGDERTAINAAFDELVAEIKTKTTEQGTALFSRTPRGTDFAAEVLQELASVDELFRYPVSNGTTIDAVMADIDPSVTFEGDATRDDEKAETGADVRWMFKTNKGAPVYVFQRGREVWMDLSRLERGEGGSALYAGAMNYAFNTNRVFIGDPAGLSDAAIVRRTQNMLSSALRFGTTRHMRAAEEQERGSAKAKAAPLAWRDGDDVANVRAMIDTVSAYLEATFPEAAGVRFDFSSGRFVDATTNEPAGGVSLEVLADQRRGEGASKIGSATLRRGVLLRSLLQSGSGERPGILEQVLRRSRELVAQGDLSRIFSRNPNEDPADAGFSASGRPKGKRSVVRAKDVEAAIAPIRRAGRGLPPVVTVQHQSQLPEDLQAAIEADGSVVEGAFHNGSIYLIGDNIVSTARAVYVMLHEAAHYGLEGVFGRELNAVLMKIHQDNEAVREAVAKLRAEYPQLSLVKATEEALADMAGRGERPTFVQKFIAWIRDWFRRRGINLKMTDGDVLAIIARAQGYWQRPTKWTHLYSTSFSQRAQTGEEFAVDVLAMLADVEDLYQFPMSEKKSLEGIAADLSPALKVSEIAAPSWNVDRVATVTMPDGAKAMVRIYKDGAVDLDASLLEEGQSRGALLYALVSAYAHNNGKLFIGDPNGLSDAALFRRTEHMIASAMKFDTTEHLYPHERQVAEGLKWEDGKDNLGNLLEFSRALLGKAMPEIADVVYNFRKRRFESASDGTQISDAAFDRMSASQRSGARAARAGRATLKRGAFLNTLARATSGEARREVLGDALRQLREGLDPDLRGIFYSRAPGNPAAWTVDEPSRLDNVVYSLQDKHVDTRRVLQAIKAWSGKVAEWINPYLREELYHGRTARRTEEFLRDELRPLLAEMAQRGVSMPEFEEYLWNRHAEERNRQIAKVNPAMPDGGSGIDTKDARGYLSGLTAQRRKMFEALANHVDAITAETRAVLIGYGLESPSTMAAWEQTYKHYVPLMREDMEQGFGNGTGQGFSVRGKASKRATGSDLPVSNIMANIALARERAITRGEKNRVATALYGLAKASPNPDFWKVDAPPKIKTVNEQTGLVEERVDPTYKTRENVIVARVPDGQTGEVQEVSIVFNERSDRAQRMAQALKNLDADRLGVLLGMSAKITRYFASINTQYNPVFGIVNALRDVQSGLVNLTTTALAGQQAEVLKNVMPALRGIYGQTRAEREGKSKSGQWEDLWGDFQAEGGQTGYRDMWATGEERAKAIEKEIKALQHGRAFKTAKAAFDWLADYNTAIENAVRLSAYKTALDSGMTKAEAASLAKNLTVNFNRKGQIATQAGALYAFFNASVQGSARMAETLAGPLGRRIIISGITLGVVEAVMMALAGLDDDEPPQWERERNFIIPTGAGTYVKIPMPLGLHVLPNLGRIAGEFAMGGFKRPGESMVNLLGVVLDAFNPIGNAGMSMQTIAPTIVDPFAALAENKDWTGKPIYRPDYNSLAPTPGYTRAKDTASALAKGVAYGINILSGGSDYRRGLLSPTPDQIDYLIGQVTGGVGREASKVIQVGQSLYTGEELPTYKIPVVGRLIGTTDGQSSQGTRFYANVVRMAEHEAELKGRLRNNESVDEYLEDNPEARLWRHANKYETLVQALRRRKREMADRDASNEDLREMDDRITQAMAAFNQAVARTRQGSTASAR